MKNLILSLIILGICNSNYAQDNSQTETPSNELVLLAGLIQPIVLHGGNFEVDFYRPHMVFNYSHGFSLEMNSEYGSIAGDALDQSVAYHIPYSTGFGVGYRLNKYFDIRVESKWHKFQAYYDSTSWQDAQNQIVSYSTFTLGLGAYFRWKPFEKKTNALKGIFTSTSLRYWPRISSTLDDDQYSYYNRVTGKNEILPAANIGIANSPFIFNLALGYSFMF